MLTYHILSTTPHHHHHFLHHREPVRYTTPETAEVFPTQPYSKNLRSYSMIHPEQIITHNIEHQLAMEAEREAERIEKERKDLEKVKADKASERDKRKKAKEDKELRELQREREKMERDQVARHGLGLENLRQGLLGGADATANNTPRNVTPRRTSLFDAARRIVEERKAKEAGGGPEGSSGEYYDNKIITD